MVIYGRVQEHQVKMSKKMIKNFCNTTLTDIFLLKLKKLQSKGYNVFFAGYEKIFEEKCKNTQFHLFSEQKNQQKLKC